jgi:hypothetical protein
MDDDLTNVQRYPGRYRVELWPEPQPVRAALSLIIVINYQGPYRVAVVLGRGKLAKIEVALSNWLVELGGYQVKLLGEQLRKDGALRRRDPRSGFQFKQQMLQWGSTEVRAGERALKAETAKS